MLRERNSSRISEERGDPSLNSQRENFHGSLRRTPVLECSEREILSRVSEEEIHP